MNITKHRIDICLEDLNCLSKHQDEQEKRLVLRSPPNKAATTRPKSHEPSKRILELHRFGTRKIWRDRMYAEESRTIYEAPIIVVKMVEDEP